MQIEIVTNDVPPAQRTRHMGQKGYFFKSYEELRHTRDLTTLPHGIFFSLRVCEYLADCRQN